MNDHELDRALADMGARHVQVPVPPALRARVRAVPLQTPQQRSWLPRLPEWRLQTMFSATKFVVAGAIVTLFGGFLLAGLLMQPSDVRVPAAVTDSPGPTELLPGVDLVTEEVELGVHRVVSDGVRNLSRVADDEEAWLGGVLEGNIVAGLDGSVWWLGPEGFHRLGDETTHTWPEGGRGIERLASDDFAVALDGTLWRSGVDVSSFDGEAWIELDFESTIGSDDDLRPVGGVEARADGTVWITWADPSPAGDPRTLTTTRLTSDGWEQVPASFPWIRIPGPLQLAVAEETEGEAWLVRSEWGLYRIDEGEWQRQPTPPEPGSFAAADVGPDGTLWARYDDDPSGNTLARLDGTEWQTFTDGIPRIGGHYMGFTGWFEVGPDGSVWFNPFGDYEATGTECDGVASFDGVMLNRFLRDSCIYAMDIAPNGAVWLQAGPSPENPPNTVHTYVITPEAAAAADDGTTTR
jgi:hypothetical protein